MALKLGMFLTPATLPSRSTSELIDWNLDVIRKAEEVGKFWSHYFKPICEKLHAQNMFRPRGADPDAEVTAEYLVDHGVWFVGDPGTVAQRIREQFKVTGGFGTILQLGGDYSDPGAREGWFRSMELLAREVMPRLGDLGIPGSPGR